MSTRETLTRLLDSLSEERLKQLLDFANYLKLKEEQAEWERGGLAHFATCYGPDEPDYGDFEPAP